MIVRLDLKSVRQLSSISIEMLNGNHYSRNIENIDRSNLSLFLLEKTNRSFSFYKVCQLRKQYIVTATVFLDTTILENYAWAALKISILCFQVGGLVFMIENLNIAPNTRRVGTDPFSAIVFSTNLQLFLWLYKETLEGNFS